MDYRCRAVIGSGLVFALLALGVAGYVTIEGWSWLDATLEQACRDARSVTVLAVRRADGTLSVGRPGQTALAVGDQLVVLGEEEDVRALG